MIMYVIATGKQPFANCAHDEVLALNICNGIRPEINDQIAPKSRKYNDEINNQFKETREYRKKFFHQ
ncbi:hypothetical protein RhiirA5_435065 [Rhizophagus irregularis]|uniref:Protein kinase domain-containing protein n=1 Tax=Rhizophagus irregularis TaxID=588596 RepID=A0A2N0NNZ8_9GLOM|nr:hypothetical protein RhiirA5_435065 [Rhizophagus irregularis]